MNGILTHWSVTITRTYHLEFSTPTGSPVKQVIRFPLLDNVGASSCFK
jgi:hypothetical protein